jgi:hypothetical protein
MYTDRPDDTLQVPLPATLAIGAAIFEALRRRRKRQMQRARQRQSPRWRTKVLREYLYMLLFTDGSTGDLQPAADVARVANKVAHKVVKNMETIRGKKMRLGRGGGYHAQWKHGAPTGRFVDIPDDLEFSAEQIRKVIEDMAVRVYGAKVWDATKKAVSVSTTMLLPRRSLKTLQRRLQRTGLPNKNGKYGGCDDMLVIPQSDGCGTCWFNAVLMAFLFSDLMRQECKNAVAARWSSSDVLLHDVLQRFASLLMLYKRRVSDAAYQKIFEHGLKPELILRAVYAYDVDFFRSTTALNASSVAVGRTGFFTREAISALLHLLGIPHLFLKKNVLQWKWRSLGTTADPRGGDIRVLCVLSQPVDLPKTPAPYVTGTLDVKERVLDTHSPPLELQTLGGTFRLDATVMSSWNGFSGHAIAGITCDGHRKYYNGWQISSKRACPLIPVDWRTSPVYIDKSICYATDNKSLLKPGTFRYHAGEAMQRQCLLYVRRDDP